MAETNNHDVLGLFNRINRFIVEMFKSVSSQSSEVNEFDTNRCLSYLDAIDRFHDWIIAQPQLDLPETSPRIYMLDQPPIWTETENESVNDIVRLFELARDELIHSQTSRHGSNIIGFDSSRFRDIIEKTRKFITDYVIPTTPLDLPESSPKRDTSGTGETGI